MKTNSKTISTLGIFLSFQLFFSCCSGRSKLYYCLDICLIFSRGRLGWVFFLFLHTASNHKKEEKRENVEKRKPKEITGGCLFNCVVVERENKSNKKIIKRLGFFDSTKTDQTTERFNRLERIALTHNS